MADSSRYALHRPEILGALEQGERKIVDLLGDETIRVPGGTTLVASGEDHRFVYRLCEGWAARSRLLPDGRNQFILIFLPGDLFAVKSMFMCHHPDGICAISDLLVQRIMVNDLRAAFARDPAIATRCIWQVIEEERRLHTWVVGLGQGSAEERMAMVLLDFRRRLLLSDAIGPDSLSYAMPLTHTQLADHLGITPVHVSRVLKELRVREIASIEAGRVTIMNPGELSSLAAPLEDLHDRSENALPSG